MSLLIFLLLKGRTTMLALPTPVLGQQIFSAELPLPPVGINHSYQPVRRGQHLSLALTGDAIQFKADAALLLSRGEHDFSTINAIRNAKIKVPLAVEMTFYFPTMWKRDLDGGIKIALDAVFNHLDLNDNLVVRLVANKEVDEKNPRLEVVVRCLLGVDAAGGE